MSTRAWFLFLLKLVVAVEIERGPQCQKAPACNPNKECNTCDLTNYKINVNELSEVPGRYKTQLLGNSGCRVQILRIFLYYYAVNNTQCNKSIIPHNSNPPVHSQQKYECYDEAEIISSEDILNQIHPKVNLIHYFDMVYSGCYAFKYEVTFNNSKSTSLTEVYFIDNQLSKEHFEDLIGDVKFATNVIKSSSPVTLRIPYRLSNEEFEINIISKENFQGDITKQCQLDYIRSGSELICRLPENITQDDYVLTYKASTSWCGGYVFNKKHCLQEFNLSIIEPQPEPHHSISSESSSFSITVVAVICLIPVIIVLVIVTLYWRFGKKKRKKDEKSILKNDYMNVQNIQRDELRGIVLVYARDCEPFMEAVQQLRAVLEKRCMVKVYDIFDVSLFNAEIASAPNEWAACMLASPGVKFVLIKTRCGELLYDPIILNNDSNELHLCEPLLPARTRYRTPLYADTYVHTLFRLVKDDAILPLSYTKYFVVEIPNFSGDRQFVYVNPYTRYKLPSTLRILVSHLLKSQHQYKDGAPEQRLQEAVQALRDYVDQHPDYMMDLLYN